MGLSVLSLLLLVTAWLPAAVARPRHLPSRRLRAGRAVPAPMKMLQHNSTSESAPFWPWSTLTLSHPFAAAEHPKAHRQRLTNVGGVLYTAMVEVGGQPLSAIVDSGSFELLVMSKKCFDCGDATRLYNDRKSTGFRAGTLAAQHAFGSGVTLSRQASDSFRVGTFRVPHQDFWEVTSAEMGILQTSPFQVILGLGPPEGALRLAQDSRDWQVAEAKRIRMSDISKYAEAVRAVQRAQAVMDYTKNRKGVLDALHIQSYSICLERDEGAGGVLVWADDVVRHFPSMFVHVALAGSGQWSVELSDFSISRHPAAHGKHTPATTIGCASKPCRAIIDSGTSAIVAPQFVVDALRKVVSEWDGTCSDLSGLPYLEFALGSKPFTLPPSSYIAEVTQPSMASFHAAELHMAGRQAEQPGEGGGFRRCVLLMLSLDAAETDNGEWILGMPFFKEYYTNFQLRRQGDGEIERAVAIAAAGEDCKPVGGQAALVRSSAPQAAPFIDASQIRRPSAKRVLAWT